MAEVQEGDCIGMRLIIALGCEFWIFGLLCKYLVVFNNYQLSPDIVLLFKNMQKAHCLRTCVKPSRITVILLRISICLTVKSPCYNPSLTIFG